MYKEDLLSKIKANCRSDLKPFVNSLNIEEMFEGVSDNILEFICNSEGDKSNYEIENVNIFDFSDIVILKGFYDEIVGSLDYEKKTNSNDLSKVSARINYIMKILKFLYEATGVELDLIIEDLPKDRKNYFKTCSTRELWENLSELEPDLMSAYSKGFWEAASYIISNPRYNYVNYSKLLSRTANNGKTNLFS